MHCTKTRVNKLPQSMCFTDNINFSVDIRNK